MDLTTYKRGSKAYRKVGIVMNKITLNGKDVELYYNVKATIAITERCGGDIGNLSNILESGTVGTTLELICGILDDLANGAVAKHNCDVVMGLASGEKKDFFPNGFFLANASAKDLNDFTGAVLDTMGLGSEYTIPENVKVEEKDIDLIEIEAEKNKGKKS